MVKRIKINGYKSLNNIDIELNKYTVLFGPNASGKSNFLDILQLLSSIAYPKRTLKEAFEPPHRGKQLESFALGPGGIKSLRNEERVSFSIEVDLEISDRIMQIVNNKINKLREGIKSGTNDSKEHIKEKYFRYRIELVMLPKSGIIRVEDEFLAALSKDGNINSKRSAFIETINDQIHLRWEGQAHPRYFDKGLDYTILSEPLYLPHYPHVATVQEELNSWNFFYFEPREQMRASNPVKEVRHIGQMGQDLAAYLNTLKSTNERQFLSLQKALKMFISPINKLDVTVNDLGEVEFNVEEDGIPISSRLLSEGTLRLIGLLALSGVNKTPEVIGFEEPENGIHPAKLRLVADLLNTRYKTSDSQMIITTHSPFLLNLIDIDHLYLCTKKVGTTQIKKLSDELFKNESIKQALDNEDYETDIITKILRGDFE